MSRTEVIKTLIAGQIVAEEIMSLYPDVKAAYNVSKYLLADEPTKAYEVFKKVKKEHLGAAIDLVGLGINPTLKKRDILQRLEKLLPDATFTAIAERLNKSRADNDLPLLSMDEIRDMFIKLP